MIFFSVSLLLLLSSTIVKSQSLSDELNSLPSCSDTCLESATTSLGCSSGDFSCYCSDSNGISARSSIVSNTTSCIQDACSAIDAKSKSIVVDTDVLKLIPSSFYESGWSNLRPVK
jgi:hypothetical protein